MADQVNVNGPDTTRERVVTTSDGGMSGIVWAVLILLLLVIAYFIFAGRGDGVDTTPTTPNQTEQNTTINPGTTTDGTTENGTTDDDGTADQGTGDN